MSDQHELQILRQDMVSYQRKRRAYLVIFCIVGVSSIFGVGLLRDLHTQLIALIGGLELTGSMMWLAGLALFLVYFVTLYTALSVLNTMLGAVVKWHQSVRKFEQTKIQYENQHPLAQVDVGALSFVDANQRGQLTQTHENELQVVGHE